MAEEAWTKVIEGFQDTFIMQTWAYGARRWGAENLSHLVMRKNGTIAAAAQVVIMKIPLLGRGIAYVKWGPLWQPRGHERDPQVFRMMIRSLRETFAVRRGLLLRIFPNAVEDGTTDLSRIFQEEGFTLNSGPPSKTVLIDLSHPLDELRKSLAGKWRSCLRNSEKNGLNVTEGIADEFFGQFTKLYKEMQARKKRPEIFDIDDYAAMQRDLSATLKLRVMLCKHEGEPIAGVALSLSGDTALLLFAATAGKALELGGSYFLFWQVIERLKADGYRWFDLHGINHETTPGPSKFKARLAGTRGRFTQYLGQFEACENTMSWYAVKLADRVVETHRRARAQISDWLHHSTVPSAES
jgi:lipid II:glycine glycyltransferase (peptidoglycan interpeptide bridge formation enzyme)